MIARVIYGNNDIYSLSKTLMATYEPTKSVFLLDEQLILNDIRAVFSFLLETLQDQLINSITILLSLKGKAKDKE